MGPTNVTVGMAIFGASPDPLLSVEPPNLNGSGTGSGLPPMMPRPPQPDAMMLRMNTVLYVLHLYYQPSIIGLGLTFNMVALIVLVPSKLTALSSTRYLVASTIVDFLYLLMLLVTWLAERGLPVYRMGAFCHVTNFFLRAASFLTTWYAVALSVDRFLSLCLPGWERTLCSPTRANVVVVGLALIALVVYLNISLTVGVVQIGHQYVCTSLHVFMAALNVLNRIDTVLNILLPYTILILLWLVNALRCCVGRSSTSGVARRRTVVSTRGQVTLDTTTGLADGQNGTYFLYILTLLLLTGPLQLEQCRQTFKALTAPTGSFPRRPSPSAMFLLQVLKYPYYTRFCLNFFICCTTHRGLRLVIAAVVRRVCRRCQNAAFWTQSKKQTGLSRSGSALSLDDLQEEEQSRVALCATNDSACSRV